MFSYTVPVKRFVVRKDVMERKKIALRYLKQVFEGKDWCITSGAAVKAYTGDREVDDIDVLTTREDAEEVAQKTGKDTVEWEIHGDDLKAKEEVYFSFSIESVPVEVMAGDSVIQREDESVKAEMDEKLFENSQEVELFGEKVPVAPVEELIVQRAVLGRPKDARDLRKLISDDIDFSVLQDCVDARNITEDEFFRMLEEQGFKVKKPA